MRRGTGFASRMGLAGLCLATALRAQWISIDGPTGGGRPITALCAKGDTVFAGTKGTGLFRSYDGGGSWVAANNGMSSLEISSIGVKGSIWFANNSYTMAHSFDNGNTWKDAGQGLFSYEVEQILAYGDYVFAVTGGAGLNRTANNGGSWVRAAGIPTDISCLAASPAYVFAGTEHSGVFRSSDSGNSWIQFKTGIPLDTDIISLAIMGKYVLAGTYGGVLSSEDSGSTWKWIHKDDRLTALLARGPDLFASGSSGIFRSADTGKTWTRTISGLTDTVVLAMTVSGSSLLAGTATAGIFRSGDNGDSWVQSNRGLINASAHALLVRGDDLFAGTYNGGVYRYSRSQRTWTQGIHGLKHTNIGALGILGRHLVAGSWEGPIFHSTDAGANWDSSAGLTPGSEIESFASIGNYFMAASSNPLRSLDSGASWSSLAFSDKDSVIYNGGIGGFAQFNGQMFASSESGILRSADSGRTWSLRRDPDAGLEKLLAQGGALFAGLKDEVVRRSQDGGSTWEILRYASSETSLDVFASNGSSLFMATSTGFIYLSVDNGVSWTEVESNLPKSEIYSLAASGDTLFAGVGTSGVWQRSISEMRATVAVGKPRSVGHGLAPSSPLRSGDKVEFRLDRPSRVRLELSDIHGSLIATLLDAFLPAGPNQVVLGNLGGSGLRLLRLKTDRLVQTRQILVSGR